MGSSFLSFSALAPKVSAQAPEFILTRFLKKNCEVKCFSKRLLRVKCKVKISGGKTWPKLVHKKTYASKMNYKLDLK